MAAPRRRAPPMAGPRPERASPVAKGGKYSARGGLSGAPGCAGNGEQPGGSGLGGWVLLPSPPPWFSSLLGELLSPAALLGAGREGSSVESDCSPLCFKRSGGGGVSRAVKCRTSGPAVLFPPRGELEMRGKERESERGERSVVTRGLAGLLLGLGGRRRWICGKRTGWEINAPGQRCLGERGPGAPAGRRSPWTPDAEPPSCNGLCPPLAAERSTPAAAEEGERPARSRPAARPSPGEGPGVSSSASLRWPRAAPAGRPDRLRGSHGASE